MSFAHPTDLQLNRQPPPAAPSEGRMESLRRGASGMDAARAVKGHGWPLRGDPRSSDGMREVERSETRMSGQAFLVTFSAFGKSDSPSRAKPMRSPAPPSGPRLSGPSQKLRGQDRSHDSACARARLAARLPEAGRPALRWASRPAGQNQWPSQLRHQALGSVVQAQELRDQGRSYDSAICRRSRLCLGFSDRKSDPPRTMR